jgi:hypothetical protein
LKLAGNATADVIHTMPKLPLFGLVVLHFAEALLQQFVLRTQFDKPDASGTRLTPTVKTATSFA